MAMKEIPRKTSHIKELKSFFSEMLASARCIGLCVNLYMYIRGTSCMWNSVKFNIPKCLSKEQISDAKNSTSLVGYDLYNTLLHNM